jgi:formylmethanofuran dehydrogenase subunit E
MVYEQGSTLICGKPIEVCLQMIERFHGWKAPGLVLGLFMVDLAQELIGCQTEADAVVETRHCLPDAIQLFTPCTIGNGWLKILDWDKFALTLYDRRTQCGFRVWVDLDKLRRFPRLFKWYMRLIPKRALPLEELLDLILTARRQVLSDSAVTMFRHHKRIKKTLVNICPVCNEAFAANQGAVCLACQGEGYYDIQNQNINDAAVGSS